MAPICTEVYNLNFKLSFPLNSEAETKPTGKTDSTAEGKGSDKVKTSAKPVSEILLIRVAKKEELESLIKHF